MGQKDNKGGCRDIFTAACLEGGGHDVNRIMARMEPDGGSATPSQGKQPDAHKPVTDPSCKTETVYRAACHPPGFAPSALD